MTQVLSNLLEVGFAWFALFGSSAAFLLFVGKTADNAVREEVKSEVSSRLQRYSSDWSEPGWIRAFSNSLDVVFGKSHFSFRCLLTSLSISVVSFLLLINVFGNELVAEFDVSLLLNDEDGQERTFEFSLAPLAIIWIAAVFNGVADYFSLLQTRVVLRSQLSFFKKAILDFILTLLIVFTWFTLYFRLNYPTLLDSAIIVSELLFNWAEWKTGIAVVLTSFTTSIWLWLHGVSRYLIKVNTAARAAIGWIEIEKRPFYSISALSSMLLIIIGFALFPLFYWASVR